MMMMLVFGEAMAFSIVLPKKARLLSRTVTNTIIARHNSNKIQKSGSGRGIPAIVKMADSTTILLSSSSSASSSEAGGIASTTVDAATSSAIQQKIPLFDFSDSTFNSTNKFERIDDVIMGGISSSILRQVEGEQFARWSGVCRTDGGYVRDSLYLYDVLVADYY